MAKAKEVGKQKPASPFGAPVDDEVFEVLIPEGAESGRIPEGDQYIGKLIGVTKGVGKESGNPWWQFTATITEGQYMGFDFSLWCTLTEQALWKLADTLNALGVDWEPGVQLKFRAKDVVGTGVRLSIIDEKYQGSTRSKLAALLPHPDGAGIKVKGGSAFVVPKKAAEEDESEEPVRRRRPVAEAEEPAPRRRQSVAEEVEEEEEPAPKRRPRRAEPEEVEEEEPTPRRKKPVEEKDDDWEEPPASPPKRRGRPVEEEEEYEEPAPVRRRKPSQL